MPHRTTYFFPRQFPDNSSRGFDASAKQLLDHEKQKIISSSSSSSSYYSKSTSTAANKKSFDVESDSKESASRNHINHPPASDLFTGGTVCYNSSKQRRHQSKKQLANFCDWLVERKGGIRSCGDHVKPRLPSNHEDREPLLSLSQAEAEPVAVADAIADAIQDRCVDRNFDRQVSLPRLSSGSSYAASFFSGTTSDGNVLSSDVNVKESLLRIESSRTRQDVQAGEKEEEEASQACGESLAQRTRESYDLQLTLAKRLTSQAGLAIEPVLLQASAPEDCKDAATVSYRLWVRTLAPLFVFPG